MNRATAVLVAGLSLTLGVMSTASSAEAVTPKKYQSCAKLIKDYSKGVGKPGARDKTSGVPVTNFKVSKKIYQLNKAKDTDKDGIVCEKKRSRGMTAPAPIVAPAPVAPQPVVGQPTVTYKNCDAVRAAGRAPIRRGDPGYGSHLDRDGDGIGCE